ncbi:hypothetical protein Pint_06174 [Pistacia integerrima]|uniref:Uncharacterized protein n=1 Tax=Pistacia integerrima TaxID=434235 RepID=A0ACC0Z9A3_9ROSI|nr:hypothetical protein Pint_06174 [Pistacia integerrima]
MTLAKFSVSAQSFTLIKEYQSGNGSLVKEYSLNITSDKLVLTFTPLANSFAFLNAIEVFSLPPELIPEGATTIGSQTGNQNLQKQALETVARVNMGNETVTRQTDPLWRLWVADDSFLVHNGLAKFVSNVKAVNFTGEKTKEEIAPADVYGTATMLNSEPNPSTNANVTWIFDVDPGFEYLVRFHFCDISNTSQPILFNVYINSWYASHDFNLQKFTSKTIGAPYYMDSIIRVTDSRKLSVSVGPSAIVEGYPNAFLNGLEIMKVNNSRGSFDVLESKSNFSTDSKMKVGLIVGLAAGLFVVVVLVLVLFLLCRRRKKLAQIGHSKAEDKFGMNGGGATAIFSSSKIGYRYPFVAIQEATENFNESLVVGVGGFGKVYKGVLRDKTMVAVKRGGSQSHQGLAEFRTEIEMLSQFRHRHLVSLIGYCDEKDEMIIIYEYMENVEWAINCQKRGHLEDIVDPKIMDQIKPESLKKFGEIVEKCLAESGLDRPSMGDVLWNLEYAFQLQGNEEKSSPNGETSSQANLDNQSHSTISITDFSMGSVDDLAGVSMSKVFAQIVQEEARES